MNDSEKKSNDWKLILGGVLLIAVLFLGVQFIFWGLEQTIGRGQSGASQGVSASQSTSQSVSSSQSGREESPRFCVHCGKSLPESFQWGQFCPWCGEKMEGET